MSHLFFTLVATLIIILIALSLIGIGYLITGKSRVHIGTCGRAPKSKKDEKCGKDETCAICSPPKKEDPKKEDDVQQGKS